MEIKGLTAVVTGGASGLGEACVRDLIREGARVAIFDLARDQGAKLADEFGGEAMFWPTDVTNEDNVKAGIAAVVEKFGAVHLNINCAGIGIPAKILGKDGPLALGAFAKVVQVNLIGTVNVLRFAAEKMALNEPNAEGERGVIINTASVAAYEGQIGQAAYAASKGGIVGLTLPAARELAKYGIRVMTIAPGLFHTPMLAGLPVAVQESLGKQSPFPTRLGRPTEFAMLANHIIKNPMLNGSTIRLDAAIRMQPK
ncbi:MAG: 3-hydroxyacyl-CoA dehydrogenase [Pseudomonadota bacterium]